MYSPKPIDTTKLNLPGELLELTEMLAENAHEIWASERIRQGWKHGKERNDVEKTHPCLVPYSQLPDAEKEFDRKAAIGTLKVILSLGFRIVKDTTET